MVMVLLAAAALAATPPVPHPVSAVVQATVSIRVLSGVQLRLDGTRNPGAPLPRESMVKAADGSTQRAKLIEFQ